MLQDLDDIRPYAPSFMDRFMEFVEHLPWPYWLTYLMLCALQGLIVHTVAWIAGWLPPFTLLDVLFFFPVWLWGPLTIMTYIDSVALGAFSSYSPLLELDDQKLARLKYEFRIMPSRNVILSCITWTIIHLMITSSTVGAFSSSYGPGISGAVVVEGIISFGTASVVFYHSLRQLRLVHHTVKLAKQFSLFRLDPVYAFSRVTSLIGMSWMVMLSLTLLLFPIHLANAVALSILVFQVVLAIAAFVLPLWFVNRRLVAEKRRLLAELNRRVETTLQRLHRYVDDDELGEVELLNSAMTGLQAERDYLTAIPTWPWRSGTLTGFMSAIALPIVLFLIQLAVEKWLGA